MFLVLTSERAHAQNVRAAFDAVLPSVVRLHVTGETEDQGPVDGWGTGFFVDGDGYILTAFHVIGKKDQSGPPVQWREGSPVIEVEMYQSGKLIAPEKRVGITQ